MFAFRVFIACYGLTYCLLLNAIFYQTWFHGFKSLNPDLIGLAVCGLVLMFGIMTSYLITKHEHYKRTVNQAYAVWTAEAAKKGHIEPWALPYGKV